MSPVTCVVVDDEQHAVDMLAEYVRQTPFLQLLHATTSALEALQWAPKAQLCISDVDMPGLTGIQLAQALRGRTRFILCTAYAQYAVDGFEHDVVDYLVKPVEYARFCIAAEKARALLEAAPPAAAPGMIFLPAEGKGSYQKLLLDDIVYVQAEKNYIVFHTTAKKHFVHITMKEAQARLPAGRFMRVHNSYIVNLRAIEGLQGNLLLLPAPHAPIPVSDSYRPALLQALHIAKPAKGGG